jgi:hypothetical protein
MTIENIVLDTSTGTLRYAFDVVVDVRRVRCHLYGLNDLYLAHSRDKGRLTTQEKARAKQSARIVCAMQSGRLSYTGEWSPRKPRFVEGLRGSR